MGMMRTRDLWITDVRRAGKKITHYEVWYYDPFRKRFYPDGWITAAKAEKLEREGTQDFFKGKVVEGGCERVVRSGLRLVLPR